MSYKLKHRTEGDYFRITLFGSASPEELNLLSVEIAKLVTLEKPKKMMIDATRMEGRFSMFASLDNVNKMPPEFKSIHIAVLDTEKNDEHDQLYEMFATNHNFHIRFFHLKEDAQLWLKNS